MTVRPARRAGDTITLGYHRMHLPDYRCAAHPGVDCIDNLDAEETAALGDLGPKAKATKKAAKAVRKAVKKASKKK